MCTSTAAYRQDIHQTLVCYGIGNMVTALAPVKLAKMDTRWRITARGPGAAARRAKTQPLGPAASGLWRQNVC
jgi:hypothetical protein